MSIISIAGFGRHRLGRPLLAATFAAILLWPQVGAAQQSAIGPFAKFDGSWRGSGQVTGADGKHERITCRASYSIPPSGAALSQSLVCASDSYRFEVQSDVVVTDGHSVQGRWQETTRSATGDLVGQVADGRFQGTVSGAGFTAEILIRMNGAKQAVTIVPHGSNVAKVDIVLSREG
jgi:hypothetical protein